MKQRQKFRTSEMEDCTLTNRNREDDNEGIELKIKPFAEQRTIETEIRPGDTLQALSIRFQCPVAELKRLNNLHRENEIHARRTIKVPFRPFSMVGVHKSGDSSPNANLTKISVDADSLKERLTIVSSDFGVGNRLEGEPVAGCSHHEVNGVTPNFNEIIFNTRITAREDLQEEEIYGDSAEEEEVHLLPNVKVAEPIHTEFNCSGHDWGISWRVLLGIILLLAFAVPIILYFDLHKEPEKHHPS